MAEAAQAKNLHIITFGCQMNVYDSDRMAGLLAPLGYSEVSDPATADLILLNTCSVRQNAEHKVYSYMGRLAAQKKRNPGLLIGIGGCLAQQEGKRLLRDLPHLDLVFGTGVLDRLPELVADAAQGKRRACLDLKGALPTAGAVTPAKVGLKAQLTIMRGCDNFCAYCVVPHTRGREHSRPATEVAGEAAALVEAGAREITLLGQNVNSYQGPEGLDFAGLLEMVAQTPGLKRLRFVTSHPKDLSLRLIRAMTDIPQVMEQIHFPAQSGSNRILKAMNRGYTREQYLEKVALVRETAQGVALGGDIIVGFPGESEQDFSDTLSLLDQVRYDFLFSFKYSDRPNTRALKMGGKLDEEVKARRLDQVIEMQRRIIEEINLEQAGQEVEVLVEGEAKRGHGFLCGRSRAGRLVEFAGKPELQGELVKVRMGVGGVNTLMGRITPALGEAS